MPLRYVVAFLYKKYAVKVFVRAKKQCGTLLHRPLVRKYFNLAFAC